MSGARKDIRPLVTLRALVAVGLGLLLLPAGAAVLGGLRAALLLAFLLSNGIVLAARRLSLKRRSLDLLLVTLDTAIISALLYPAGTSLPLIFFLVLLLVALGRGRPVQLVAATAVAALDGWLAWRTGATLGPALMMRLPFFYSVALYYGSFVEDVRRERAEAARVREESRELRTVVQILEEITSSLDQREVMQAVVEHIARIIPAQRVSMLLLDRAGQNATVLASSDDAGARGIRIDLAKYPEVRLALREHKSVVLEDLVNHEMVRPYREELREIGFNSVMALPLVFANQALGSLLLKAASHEMRFDPDQVRFCQAVATAAANALKNALLHHELQRAADRHHATAAELQKILDHSPDLIVTTDGGGRIVRHNPGAERLLGKDGLDGRPIDEVYPGLGTPEARELLGRGESWLDHEAELTGHDGRHVEVDITVVPLETGESGGRELLLVGRDVTELNANRRALQHADRLTGLGEIVSGVAHELNNPLSGVMGHAQLLEGQQGLDEHARRDARAIVEHAKRCRRVVRNLLDFARRRPPEMTMASLTEVIDTVLDLCAYQIRTSRVRVTRNVSPNLPCTVMDPHRTEQVLVNLIQNAIHALGREDRAGTISVTAFREGSDLVVEVADDGPGVPPEMREKIFEPFFSTKREKGTGLGLSIAAGIMAEQEGRIEYHTRQAGGAAFRVYLPIRSSPARATEAAS